MRGEIEGAKTRLPLPELMQQLGLGEHAKKSARCPFHDDQRNSFSIWRNQTGWFFKCHAGCGAGDEINFLELHQRISPGEATKLFLEMAGVNGCTPHAVRPNDKRTPDAFNWRFCVEAFSEEHLEWLVDWRGLSGAFCSWLHQRGLVGLCGPCIAFPIPDNGAVVAAHYRLNDGSWRVFPRIAL